MVNWKNIGLGIGLLTAVVFLMPQARAEEPVVEEPTPSTEAPAPPVQIAPIVTII